MSMIFVLVSFIILVATSNAEMVHFKSYLNVVL